MHNETPLKRAAGLVDRMASALGIDLEEEALRGHLAAEELPDAVLRCATCSDPEACSKWLDKLEGKADAPPVYCRNAAMFHALMKR